MTTGEYDEAIKTGELPLNFWDKVSHFGISFFLAFVSFVILVSILIRHFQTEPSANYDGEIWLICIPAILGALFYWLQKSRLKFRVFETTLSKHDLVQVIERVAKDDKWRLKQLDANIFIAKTDPGFFSGSWGEQITILIAEKKVLVNSICDLDKRSSLVSWGRNEGNVKYLIDNIKASEHK